MKMKWGKVYIKIPLPLFLIDFYLIKKHGFMRCKSCNRVIHATSIYCQWCSTPNPKEFS